MNNVMFHVSSVVSCLCLYLPSVVTEKKKEILKFDIYTEVLYTEVLYTVSALFLKLREVFFIPDHLHWQQEFPYKSFSLSRNKKLNRKPASGKAKKL